MVPTRNFILKYQMRIETIRNHVIEINLQVPREAKALRV